MSVLQIAATKGIVRNASTSISLPTDKTRWFASVAVTRKGGASWTNTGDTSLSPVVSIGMTDEAEYDYDAESDEDLMERLRGYRMLGAQDWDEEKKLDLFMAHFHPDRQL